MLRPCSSSMLRQAAKIVPRAMTGTVASRMISSSSRVPLTAATQRPVVMTKMQSPRFFSVVVSDMISNQATSAMASVAKAQQFMESADWHSVSPSNIEMLCEEVGRGRDFLNSLSSEDYAAIEAAKGTAAAVNRAEQMLVSCMKSEDIAERAHVLKMEMEDKGTAGDGDCRPENWQAAWGETLDAIFEDYATLLEETHPDDVVRVERSVGYQLLLLKRVVHVDSFRYLYPKVHPSGFSASSD